MEINKKDKLFEKINDYLKKDDKSNGSLYFIKKFTMRDEKKIQFNIIKASLNKDAEKDFLSGYSEYNKILKKKDFSDDIKVYDFINYKKDYIYKIKTNEKFYPKELKNKQSVEYNKKLKLNDYSYFFYEIEKDGEYIRLFGKLDKLQKLTKAINFSLNNEYNIKPEKIVGISSKIDIVEYKDYIYFFNENIFERIFEMSDLYEYGCNQVLKCINNLNIIENFEDFKEKCTKSKKNKRYLASEYINQERIKKNFEKINVSDISMINSEYDTKFKFEDGKIVFEETTNIGGKEVKIPVEDYINLIRDVYAKTIIGKKYIERDN